MWRSPLCSNRPDTPSLIAVFWPFLAIFLQLSLYFWQNWGADGHLEVLNRAVPQFVQKLWHKNAKEEVTTRRWLSNIFNVVSLIFAENFYKLKKKYIVAVETIYAWIYDKHFFKLHKPFSGHSVTIFSLGQPKAALPPYSGRLLIDAH